MTERGFHQIAYVVTDLDAAVRSWADVLAVGPWQVWTMAPPTLLDQIYRGKPASFGFRHALATSGHLQFELIQPLYGPSVFTDQLREHGPGAHHIGRIVDNHPAAVADLLDRGFVALQSGRFGASADGLFAYFTPPDGIGTTVELISPPSERFPPDYIYPSLPTTKEKSP